MQHADVNQKCNMLSSFRSRLQQSLSKPADVVVVDDLAGYKGVPIIYFMYFIYKKDTRLCV